MSEGTDWVRVRGMGRERSSGYVAEFLTSNGFEVTRSEGTDPVETRIHAKLGRMNPGVPTSLQSLEFRVVPTGGGSAVFWVNPVTIQGAEKSRVDRFVREFVAHLERAVMTESHATAKVTRAPSGRMPWDPPGPAPAASGPVGGGAPPSGGH